MGDDDELHEDVRFMPDLIPRDFVLRVIAALVLISVALCIIAYLLLGAREGSLRAAHRFPERDLPAPHVVGNIRGAPFRVPEAAPATWGKQPRAVDTYEWVDRDRRVARIPVRRAIELMLRRNAATPELQP